MMVALKSMTSDVLGPRLAFIGSTTLDSINFVTPRGIFQVVIVYLVVLVMIKMMVT